MRMPTIFRSRTDTAEHREEHQHPDHRAGDLETEEPDRQLADQLAAEQGEHALEHREVGHGADCVSRSAGQDQRPEAPRRKHPVRWVSTMPVASISA